MPVEIPIYQRQFLRLVPILQYAQFYSNCQRAATIPAAAKKSGLAIDPALTSASEDADAVAASPLPVTVPTDPSLSVVAAVASLTNVVSVLVMVVSVVQVSEVSEVSPEVSEASGPSEVSDGTEVLTSEVSTSEVSSDLESVFSASVAVVCAASVVVFSASVVGFTALAVVAGASTAVVASVLGASSPDPRSIGFPSSGNR